VQQLTDSLSVSDKKRDKVLSCYQFMLMARMMEEKLTSLYRAGGRIVGGVYCGKGQEAFSAAMGLHLMRGTDVFGPLIRDQAGRLAFGEPVLQAFQTYFGTVRGPMRGRDGNVHRGEPREGIPAMISHLGAMISVVCGMLLARRMQGKTGFVGATSIGDGGTSTGSFHEAVNMAAVEKLPLVLAVANNQFAYSTPNTSQFACDSLVDRAIGYGVAGFEVDATDLVSCIEGFEKAIANARAGEGPQMVVGSLLRLSGHGEHDDAAYVPDSLKQSAVGRDCIQVAQDRIQNLGWMDGAALAKMEEACRKEIELCVEQACSEALPDPYATDWSAISNAHLTDTYSLES
jgi:pyruvate dehydrogenase E1 component alpha subunit/2-oxoisovalerate dehydrogenase E1 component alpha subunit